MASKRKSEQGNSPGENTPQAANLPATAINAAKYALQISDELLRLHRLRLSAWNSTPRDEAAYWLRTDDLRREFDWLKSARDEVMDAHDAQRTHVGQLLNRLLSLAFDCVATLPIEQGLGAIDANEETVKELNQTLSELAEVAACESIETTTQEVSGGVMTTDSLTKEQIALALLVKHPEWSDAEIAKAVSCSRTSLYRWTSYRKARKALEQSKAESPTGYKDADGNLDAWE